MDAKKPQLLEDLVHVVPSPAQKRIHRVTVGTFEEVAGQSVIGLHVSDHRIDRMYVPTRF